MHAEPPIRRVGNRESLGGGPVIADVRQPRRVSVAAMKKILMVLTGLVGCLLGGCYNEKSLKGDAVISDTGFWTYPRYHIEFPAVSLDREGRAVFKVSGLPREELTLLLYVDGQDISQREVLEGLVLCQA